MNYEVIDEQLIKIGEDGVETEKLMIEVKYEKDDFKNVQVIEFDTSVSDTDIDNRIIEGGKRLSIDRVQRNFKRQGTIT